MMVKVAFASFEISIVADIWDPLNISYRNSTNSILKFHGNTNHHKWVSTQEGYAFAYYLCLYVYTEIFIFRCFFGVNFRWFSDVFWVNFRWFSDDFPCSSEKELLLLWLLSKAGETDVVGKVLLRDKYCAPLP